MMSRVIVYIGYVARVFFLRLKTSFLDSLEELPEVIKSLAISNANTIKHDGIWLSCTVLFFVLTNSCVELTFSRFYGVVRVQCGWKICIGFWISMAHVCIFMKI